MILLIETKEKDNENMHKTNDVEKVRERERGEVEGRRVKRMQKWASMRTLLHFHFAKGFIKKSVSRVWWNLFYVHVCVHGLPCVSGTGTHACLLVKLFVCSVKEIP